MNDTIVALSTPTGIGAIAVIRLSGNDAIKICNNIFFSPTGKQNLDKKKSHTVHFGYIKSNSIVVDEVMVTVFRAPKSFTTEDVVEISCHGSPYIQEQIIQLLLSNGARLATAGEFTLRAFMNGRIDLSQAEAVADLIASNSSASHDIAIKNMRGGFSNTIKELRTELLNFASLIELELDFSEEDVEFANRKQLKDLLVKTQNTLMPLIESFRLGNAIKNGVNTVIVGKPNVGKSTLLNALLNEERAIVSDIAGTTRDTIEEVLNIDGVLFRFIDTAGIRKTDDTIEKEGVKKSFEKIKQANLVIYLFDVNTTSPEELEKEIAELAILESTYLLCVANKIDMCSDVAQLEKFKNCNPVFISSKNLSNINELKNKLVSIIYADKKNRENSTIVANTRHYAALKNANKAINETLSAIENNITPELVSLDLKRAMTYLAEISGEVTNDEILGNIFSKFCIGK